ncbi:NnrS family protein [Methylocystis sp. L43]|nr:NnrS family protein [Methylocystis sp. L43]MBG0807711.1 NnrS family protein [Methylocystis sp. H15]
MHALTVGASERYARGDDAASLGHTGLALTAGPRTTAIYVLITLAAILRLFSSVAGVHEPDLLLAAGAGWTAKFALFTLFYFTPLTPPGSVRGDFPI